MWLIIIKFKMNKKKLNFCWIFTIKKKERILLFRANKLNLRKRDLITCKRLVNFILRSFNSMFNDFFFFCVFRINFDIEFFLVIFEHGEKMNVLLYKNVS